MVEQGGKYKEHRMRQHMIWGLRRRKVHTKEPKNKKTQQSTSTNLEFKHCLRVSDKARRTTTIFHPEEKLREERNQPNGKAGAHKDTNCGPNWKRWDLNLQKPFFSPLVINRDSNSAHTSLGTKLKQQTRMKTPRMRSWKRNLWKRRKTE